FNGYYNSCCYFNPTYNNMTAVNQWQHVAVTYKKTNVNESVTSLYINGELKQTDNHAAAITYQPGSTFFIGKTHDGGYFNGELDDIRVYSRLLSPNEILQLADVPMMPDLLAYLPMNGNADDMSGNGYHGTVSGAVLTQDKYSSNNSAYEFPGTGNQITLANSTGLGFQNSGFTLSAWVKYNNAYGHIIAKHTCYTGTGYVLEILNNQFTFLLDNSGTWTSVATNETFTNEKWYHVAAIYNGAGVASIYINGELKVSGPVGYNSTNTASVVISGASGSCPQINYHGSIDEVKIYGSSLDAAQVMALYKQSRGSDKAIKFDGVDDYVNLGTGWDANNFTFETWYKIASYAKAPFFISAKNNGGWLIQINNLKYINIAKTGVSSYSVGPIADADNKWHHLAVTVNATTTTFYLDGLLIGSGGYSPGFNSGNGEYSLGGKIGYAFNWNEGTMDEVRIWNTALTQTQIQDWQNRKITPDHPAYANLVGYYNFNEQNIFLTYDNKGAKTGVLTNGPIYVTSGAPIGDGSSNDFINVTKSATLNLSTGENLTSTETSGTPGGISVYVVKDPPEIQTGILGIGSNDHYFGVHVSGGTSPQYTAVYNYTGNPFVTAATEPSLQLFKRNDNSTSDWTNSGASLNTTANTLTVTGQNTEYILGSSGFGLPVTLLSFQAQKINATTAKLIWQTATELKNKGFEIQRSFDGNYFVNVGFVNGAGNSDVLKEYSITDMPGKTGRVYYRLKQIDLDGISKLSQIVSIVFDKQGLIKVYPNPAQQQVTVEGAENYNRIQLLNASGIVVKERINNKQYQLSIDLSGLKNGMYILRLVNDDEAKTIKLFISK
ncbi:MAG: LamG-like jellyroll fold domain-containing protein, partial [Chitinophagaceae bacterium]